MSSTAAAMKKRKNKFRKFQERRGRGCCRTQEELMDESKEKLRLIDYKFLEPLVKVVTAQGKIFSRKRSGYSSGCQKTLKMAIKRARYMGLMPYVG